MLAIDTDVLAIYRCEALVTWSTRHFAGKTDLPVLTPAEWLERFAGK
jgi:hypothetical protein